MALLRVHSGSFDISIAARIGVMLLASNFCIAVLSIAALKPVALLTTDFRITVSNRVSEWYIFCRF